jgi:hypothetical protein
MQRTRSRSNTGIASPSRSAKDVPQRRKEIEKKEGGKRYIPLTPFISTREFPLMM